MARLAKPAEKKQSYPLKVLLTPAEAEKIREFAYSREIPMSEWARAILLEAMEDAKDAAGTQIDPNTNHGKG